MEQTPSILRWAERRLQCRFNNAVTLAEYQNNKIIAVVVLSSFRLSGCELSIVSDTPRWGTKRFLKEVFNFCFNHAKYKRVTAMVSVDNISSIKTVKRLGFICEGKLRKAGDNGQDMWIFSMLKNECRWI